MERWVEGECVDEHQDLPFRVVEAGAMRPFSVRFTIRRIMAVVAAIALVLGIGGMVHRWNVYRRIAEYHRIAAEVASAAQKVAIWKATIDDCFNEKNGAFRHALLADWIGRMGSFHSKLRWKYSRAKWRPWRFPDPDPPPPPRPPEAQSASESWHAQPGVKR
jgi:hypothetical protein